MPNSVSKLTGSLCRCGRRSDPEASHGICWLDVQASHQAEMVDGEHLGPYHATSILERGADGAEKKLGLVR